MARSLNFSLSGTEVAVSIEKVDRKKIYGWVEKKATDRDDKVCHFGSISSCGMHIFGKESFEQGYLDEQGSWVEKTSLKVANAEGEILEKEEASFKKTIELSETVSIDEYLNHSVKSVYELDAPEEVQNAVKEADGVYKFEFNYTASYSPDPAFLVANEDALFMIVAENCGFDFIGLQEIESAVLVDDEEEEDSDELDFSMF